jgi:alginate O-acetyltransferase complex protein AlgI
MLVVILAWVPFRADSFAAAWRLWQSMAGLASAAADTTPLYLPGAAWEGFAWIAGLFALTLVTPNTQEIFRDADRARFLSWRPSAGWATVMGLAFGLGLAAITIRASSEFLYFRF